VKYAFVRSQCTKYSVRILCRVLNVSRSGYYDWCGRGPSKTALKNRQLTNKIRCFHKASHDIYGAPRIQQDLRNDGELVSRQRVGRLMKQAGIQSKVVQRFILTTQSKSTLPAVPDRLQRNFKTAQANEAWVSDTTFIRTRKGWLFLAIVLDLYSRKVVGWSMNDRNNTQLVTQALGMAFGRRVTKTTIVHADRGATYTSLSHRNLIEDKGGLFSVSRKGDCYDNAVAESFFGTLKAELVSHCDYQTREEARKSVFEYIELFYNSRRRHSYLGYISPVEYERASAPI